ncbi:Fatty acyl-CoA reductase [Temnothorax longispinosus]|uniref:Fatty acyl-CoA reductase n=1 Tax=Temnothorax longispinosus TaxID=300112 RepID=A0A4S2L1Q6_9HYME|nr:Fatty acyl-CoA reductase [Temnothorax longispinosus]
MDCPDISTIYLLIRSKKDKCPKSRLDEMFGKPVSISKTISKHDFIDLSIFKYWRLHPMDNVLWYPDVRCHSSAKINTLCVTLQHNIPAIRSEFPGTLNKIFPVKGDVGLPELGLPPKDRYMLIQRVNIVFHSVATVRFNESLKIAVNLNTMNTDRILDFVIHVSTAYSNADRREIEESIYITEVKPYTVVDMCEN